MNLTIYGTMKPWVSALGKALGLILVERERRAALLRKELLEDNDQKSLLCSHTDLSFSYSPVLQKQRDFVCLFICSLLSSSLFFLGQHEDLSAMKPTRDKAQRVKTKPCQPKAPPRAARTWRAEPTFNQLQHKWFGMVTNLWSQLPRNWIPPGATGVGCLTHVIIELENAQEC